MLQECEKAIFEEYHILFLFLSDTIGIILVVQWMKIVNNTQTNTTTTHTIIKYEWHPNWFIVDDL